MKYSKNIFKAGFLLTLALFYFQACTQVQFSKDANSDVAPTVNGDKNGLTPSPTDGTEGNKNPEDGGTEGAGGDGTPPPASCVPDVESIQVPTKLLFVVDTSGSNAYTSTFNVNGSPVTVPPTDPKKEFRAGAINNFLELYRHKTNFQWGFVTFAEPPGQIYKAHALIHGVDDQSPLFVENPNEMLNAIETFKTISDLGITPYYSAMDLAIKAIKNDPDLNSEGSPQYFVILLTDGMPTDRYNSKDVKQLTQIAPGRVRLSAVFYTSLNDNSFAETFLKAVTRTGGGVFLSAKNSDAGTSIKIDDVIPGAGKNCEMK